MKHTEIHSISTITFNKVIDKNCARYRIQSWRMYFKVCGEILSLIVTGENWIDLAFIDCLARQFTARCSIDRRRVAMVVLSRDLGNLTRSGVKRQLWLWGNDRPYVTQVWPRLIQFPSGRSAVIPASSSNCTRFLGGQPDKPRVTRDHVDIPRRWRQWPDLPSIAKLMSIRRRRALHRKRTGSRGNNVEARRRPLRECIKLHS
mgnify:CR=1 FL=1